MTSIRKKTLRFDREINSNDVMIEAFSIQEGVSMIESEIFGIIMDTKDVAEISEHSFRVDLTPTIPTGTIQ